MQVNLHLDCDGVSTDIIFRYVPLLNIVTVEVRLLTLMMLALNHGVILPHMYHSDKIVLVGAHCLVVLPSYSCASPMY